MDGKPTTKTPTQLLYEYSQKRNIPQPIFEQVEECGPSHDKLFTMRAHILTKDFTIVAQGTGTASSKRQAKQQAAIDLLAKIEQMPPSYVPSSVSSDTDEMAPPTITRQKAICSLNRNKTLLEQQERGDFRSRDPEILPHHNQLKQELIEKVETAIANLNNPDSNSSLMITISYHILSKVNIS